MTFDSAAYWEERYATGGNSGNGSYGPQAEYKAEFLNRFVREHQIETVIEFGCGDGNQLSLAEYPFYLGIDVSPTAIEMCQRHLHIAGQRVFLCRPDSTTPLPFVADLALSLDVIYHLVEDDVYEAYMRDLFAAGQRYVIIYANDVEGETRHHVRWRKFSDWIRDNAPEWRLNHRAVAPPGDFQDFHVFEKI